MGRGGPHASTYIYLLRDTPKHADGFLIRRRGRRSSSISSRSLREFALCNSRYPPTRACGWVVGSRPDGDAMTGRAGMAGTAG